MATRISDPVVPVVGLSPGRVVGLEGAVGLGLSRVGMSLLAEMPSLCRMVVVDVEGWFCPLAAWEVGLVPERLAIVRCGDTDRWPGVVAGLLDGFEVIYAEVPAGVGAAVLRRLGARARIRGAALVLYSPSGFPPGVVWLRVRAVQVVWVGIGEGGSGCLDRRVLVLELSGKGVGGRRLMVEVEDDGTGPVRVVSRLAAAQTGRSVG